MKINLDYSTKQEFCTQILNFYKNIKGDPLITEIRTEQILEILSYTAVVRTEEITINKYGEIFFNKLAPKEKELVAWQITNPLQDQRNKTIVALHKLVFDEL